MGSISLRDVGVVASTPLFTNLSLVIGESDRVGLVAANGAGKTTLLKCLAGLAEPTSGEITRSRGLRVGMVEQDMPATLLDLALAEAIRRALPPAERESEEWRVGVVLDEFETPEELRGRPVRQLSGGWQRLALIARAWITQPDTLLLDEPTNHLDLAKIQLLERWIAATARVPMVIASHDRHFLDAVTTTTLFLRPEISRSFAHPFTEARRLLKEEDEAEEARQEKELREAERLRRNAAELKNIGINSRSDLLQKKSMQLKDRAERIEQRLKPIHSERSAGEIRLANRGTHARVLVGLDDVTVTTPDGTPLFRTGRLDLKQGDRVVLLGQNGVGKSRLVTLVHRAVQAGESGMAGFRVSPSVVLAYIDQHMSQLPVEQTPFAFISGTFRLGDQRSRSLLAGAGFPVDRQEKAIRQFSPGQKARLSLLALRLAEPNFYLMDEPTTHVDIPGQEALEAEILAHEATCLIVSHDRSFVRAIGTRFLLIENRCLREIDAPDEFYATLAIGA
ncbi:MAG: ABC-F family ATP-binding cassette domain-containing protein [Alphaproteobacteria bacterium]|nr:ABC-F family ATP-binding cassette domain-containing protein [Alphaproteobacteria bacterium]